MKFELTLYDRKGVELKEGDIVKVSDGKYFRFYSEVKYLEDEKIIAPFYTFSFHSFEKVDKVPKGLNEGKNDNRYKIWYNPDPEKDNHSEKFENYLNDWRVCERLLEERCFRIERISNHVSQQKLF